MVCELLKKLKQRGDDALSNFSLRLPIGENVSREAVKPHGRSNAVLYRWFQSLILNNSFYALGHVKLWKRSQKIVGNFRNVWQ